MQVAETTDAQGQYGPKGDFRAEGKRVRDLRVLLRGKAGVDSPVNYQVLYETTEAELIHPRHRHNFHQIRYIAAGEYFYGKDHGKDLVIPAGGVCYFPEGVYYGPQIRKPGLAQVIIQWGDCLDGAEADVAYERLAKKGTFSKGIYSYVDANGKTQNIDAFAAIWEEINGRKMVYPEPRYTDNIAIKPENFGWVDDPDSPGLAHKWLGTFTEGEARIGFSKLDRDAALTAGRGKTPELLLVIKGAVRCNDRTYGLHTGFGITPADGPVSFVATEPAEFLRFIVPTCGATIGRVAGETAAGLAAAAR